MAKLSSGLVALTTVVAVNGYASPWRSRSALSSSSSEEDPFPPPLTGAQRAARAATFWSTAVPIVASYYGKYAEMKIREAVTGECLDEDECRIVWDEQHERGSRALADTITSLKGFYVKTAQIIASRRDLFPSQYTEALSGFTDDLDPMPASTARAVVEKELLTEGESFEDVFAEFDETPLGAASVAQVHRAVLTERFGGPREVAVKIQRPSIESKLLGDVANLKAVAKPLRDLPAMPLDYYTVFAELERQLADEFDFVKEAAAMERIRAHLHSDPVNRPCPLVVPRPVRSLVTTRVLVMDYLDGVPLSRARDEMIANGVDPDGPEAKLFGRELLRALTEVFGRCILESGFFHADPHPGNIFVLRDKDNNDNGGGTPRVGLIDYGQVKQISGRARETLARIMVALADRRSDDDPEDLETIGRLARELGVEINEDARPEAAAAVAMWLFDGSVERLPGGYDTGELSPDSPVKELKSFPQDLVLVGRSSILIKGLSNRLDVPWSLAAEWAPTARAVLSGSTDGSRDDGGGRTRFADVVRALRRWGAGKAGSWATRLPAPLRARAANIAVRARERRERRRRAARDSS